MTPPDRSTRLLQAFAEITAAAPRPQLMARRASIRSGLPVGTLVGAVVVIAAVALAGLIVGRPGPTPDPGAIAAPTNGASATTAAIVTPEPTLGGCDPADLAVRITGWEGAAGQRIASVELVNQGPAACLIRARNCPQLVDGEDHVLIDNPAPQVAPLLTVAPGATLTTLVSAGNYCGGRTHPNLEPPVTVAFILDDRRRIVARAADQSDIAVPPCNGAGEPGTIEMHPWAP